MVIPAAIISYLYAFNIFNFQTLALDATVVIAITFFGSTIAGIILPWRAKDVFDGSPIAKYKVPAWLGWMLAIAFAVFSIITPIRLSFKYGLSVLSGLSSVGANSLTWFVVILLCILTIINLVIMLWIVVQVFKGISNSKSMPLITLAGLVFLWFLDWLLVVWFWDPVTADGFASYAIGWSNVSSMVFMLFNYLLAAAIYFGFSYYRRKQGIQIEKVYKEIPVE